MEENEKAEFNVGTIAWLIATLIWLFAPNLLQGSIWRIPVVLTVWGWWPVVAVHFFLSRKK